MESCTCAFCSLNISTTSCVLEVMSPLPFDQCCGVSVGTQRHDMTPYCQHHHAISEALLFVSKRGISMKGVWLGLSQFAMDHGGSTVEVRVHSRPSDLFSRLASVPTPAFPVVHDVRASSLTQQPLIPCKGCCVLAKVTFMEPVSEVSSRPISSCPLFCCCKVCRSLTSSGLRTPTKSLLPLPRN